MDYLASVHMVTKSEVVRVGWEISKFEDPQASNSPRISSRIPTRASNSEERGLTQQRFAGRNSALSWLSYKSIRVPVFRRIPGDQTGIKLSMFQETSRFSR